MKVLGRARVCKANLSLQIVRQEGRLIEGCTVVRLKSSENWKNFLNMPGCRQKEISNQTEGNPRYPCGLRQGHAQQHEVSAAVAELPEKRLGLYSPDQSFADTSICFHMFSICGW